MKKIKKYNEEYYEKVVWENLKVNLNNKNNDVIFTADKIIFTDGNLKIIYEHLNLDWVENTQNIIFKFGDKEYKFRRTKNE